jgi:uncharacterized protein
LLYMGFTYLYRMKRLFAWLPFCLLLISCQPAYARYRPLKQGAAKTRSDQSLLWRISGKNLEKPSYLFGTIHMICAKDYIWTGKMKESFDRSEKVCLEMNLGDPGIMVKIAAGMMSTNGKTLKDYFTPAQYRSLSKYIKDSLGLDIALFEQVKPIMLESMITSKGSATCDDTKSYEDSLLKLAQESKKGLLGLEEPQEQIDALASIPEDTVIKELLDAIENKTTSDDTDYNQMVAAYKRQDLPALYAMLTSDKGPSLDLGVFLDERNRRWIPRMDKDMRHSSVFFAVGAGHLWGKTGVIELLRKEGYTVEPVR